MTSANLASLRAPLALLLIDIDHFKQYNDHYGHSEGDRALIEVARAISGLSRRAGDFSARYGGEEFTLIMSGSRGLHAKEHAEAIRQRVESLKIPHAGVERGVVTVSVGAAVGTPSDNESREDMFNRADEALYRAKQNGRNQVWLSDPGESLPPIL